MFFFSGDLFFEMFTPQEFNELIPKIAIYLKGVTFYQAIILGSPPAVSELGGVFPGTCVF